MCSVGMLFDWVTVGSRIIRWTTAQREKPVSILGDTVSLSSTTNLENQINSFTKMASEEINVLLSTWLISINIVL